MPASLHPIFIMRRLTLHCLLIMAAAASSEIFNIRIVPDSLIFISMAAARWPGPPGDVRLRASGILPACQCQLRASEYANATASKERRDYFVRLIQSFASLHSDFIYLFDCRKCEINIIVIILTI